MPREVNPKFQKDALSKIVDAATKAGSDLSYAVGQRHYVVGIGGANQDREDLYWLILQAENAIAKVKARAQMELAKR